MLKRAILLNRTFASAAANPALSKLEQKVSKLDNGLTVASVDAHGPISHFVVTYRAGSRYEQPDELGLVHRLRNSFGLDTANYEGSRLVWQAGSLGASLTARADQEFVTLHLAAVRPFFANRFFVFSHANTPRLLSRYWRSSRNRPLSHGIWRTRNSPRNTT